MRPAGSAAPHAARSRGSLTNALAAVLSVATKPGPITFTRMLRGPKSMARVWASPTIPNFVAV
jgi:hypothetical protein